MGPSRKRECPFVVVEISACERPEIACAEASAIPCAGPDGVLMEWPARVWAPLEQERSRKVLPPLHWRKNTQGYEPEAEGSHPE